MFGNSSDTMTRHLASFIAGKPTDGSDIETVEQAKKEICAFRELVTVILQGTSEIIFYWLKVGLKVLSHIA